MNQRKLDPDRLRALEEERDFLLSSIDDLEVEYSNGDLDDADYRELHDDYTVRAADAIRSIESYRNDVATARAARSPARSAAWVVGLLAFAIGAGWLLGQATGERGANGQITGEIEESVRQKVLRCQQLGGQQLIQEALTCFDEVLDEDPQNVEALSYRGWFLVLTAGTAQQSGQGEAADQLIASAMVNLDRAVAVDPNYPDARAFRAVVFEGLGEADAACEELDVLSGLDAPNIIGELTAPVSGRLGC